MKMAQDSENASYKIVNSKFKLHVFSTQIEDKSILYQVLVMKDSVMIFINDKGERCLIDMSIAMMSRHTKEPLASKLFGNFMDECSQTLAIKVSKKLNKQVYISYNVENDRYTSLLVERQLFLEIKEHPEKF